MWPALLLVLLSAPPEVRLPLLPLTAGEGVSEGTAASFTEALAAEVRRRPGLTVVTARDLGALLGLERQKQLLGCQTDACMAEVAGALDAPQVVSGQLSRVGDSWLLHVQVLDVRAARTVAQASRRHRGESPEGLLDLLPAMVGELLPAPLTPSSPAAPRAAAALPPPWAEKGLAAGTVEVEKLTLVTDGQGRYLAFIPFAGLEGPVLAGDAQGLHLQRVFGGRVEEDAFGFVFWEPRARVPAEGAFDFQQGTYTLTCGKKQTRFTPVPAKQARSLLERLPLREVRWQRRAWALARDEEGTYYYVDRARQPDDSTDFRVYVGTRGRVVGEAAELLASDADGEVFAFSGGRLRFAHRARQAELRAGGEKRPLTWLEVETHAPLIYAQLGAYAGARLGTPCDGAF